jgi:hypothetical protein
MALENAHSAAGGAASPSSNITEVDGFPIEEVPNPAVREQSSAEDPYQNDGAGDTLDWVIEGGEDLDGDTSRHMLAFYKDLKAIATVHVSQTIGKRNVTTAITLYR